MVGLHQGLRRDAPPDRHASGALVDRALGRQEARPAQLHLPHPERDSLREGRFPKPKLGKRKKRPDDYVEPAGSRNVVPDVFKAPGASGHAIIAGAQFREADVAGHSPRES